MHMAHNDRSPLPAAPRTTHQPFLRQISNRQRMRRPALCVTYTMSLDSARPSSLRQEM